MSNITPGLVVYSCKKCGWQGEVNGIPRCLPCRARSTKKWKTENPEKHKIQKRRNQKKCQLERPEIIRSRKRRKKKHNPEHYRAKYAQRLSWLKQGDVTKEQLVSLHLSVNGKCFYCNIVVTARFTPSDPRGFDHVISRAKKGLHTITNIVVCCRSCNERKSDHA